MSRSAAAEEDRWRPIPGHLTVDHGADDDLVITGSSGTPKYPAPATTLNRPSCAG
jgi:hypothetical protein